MGSIMKVTKIDYSLEIEDHHGISISKGDLLADLDGGTGHREYQYFWDDIEMGDLVHFTVTQMTLPPGMTVLKSSLQTSGHSTVTIIRTLKDASLKVAVQVVFILAIHASKPSRSNHIIAPQ